MRTYRITFRCNMSTASRNLPLPSPTDSAALDALVRSCAITREQAKNTVILNIEPV